MLDGEETVQIAWGELRWEGAVQHAGRIGNLGNSLRRASLGGSDTAIVTVCWTERKPWNFAESFAGSETACWTETKPWKSPAESFAGRERDSMLDGEETVQIACGELRRQGARQHSSRGNGLGRDQCRAVGAALSELLARFFPDKCHHCDCPEKLWAQDWSNGPKTGQTQTVSLRLKKGTCMAKRLQRVSFCMKPWKKLWEWRLS